MARALAESLSAYLAGEEWQKSVEMFVEANCELFRDVVDEYDLEHHNLWKTFGEIAEATLEMALQEVGGSIDLLEKALGNYAEEASSGPREDTIKHIVNQLLSYSSFTAFSDMMRKAAHNDDIGRNHIIRQESDDDNPERHYETLLNMGFPSDTVNMVLEESYVNKTNPSLEDLVITLSGMMDGGDNTAQPKTAVASAKGRKDSDSDMKTSDSNGLTVTSASAPSAPSMFSPQPLQHREFKTPSPAGQSGSSLQRDALYAFSEALRSHNDVIIGDLDDMVAKFKLADVIVESLSAGSMDAYGEGSNFLHWGSDMKVCLSVWVFTVDYVGILTITTLSICSFTFFHLISYREKFLF
jgi:hypothetical protein